MSIEEFLGYTKQHLSDKAEEKEEWHPVVDKTPFSDEEFKQYEEDYEEDYEYQYDSEGNIVGILPRSVGRGQRSMGRGCVRYDSEGGLGMRLDSGILSRSAGRGQCL